MNDCIGIRRTNDVVRFYHYQNAASLNSGDAPQWIKELMEDKRIVNDVGCLTLYDTLGYVCGRVRPGDFILQSYGTHYGQLFSLSGQEFSRLFVFIPQQQEIEV